MTTSATAARAWQDIAKGKRDERDSKIPLEWRVQHSDAFPPGSNVLHVPATCGILAAEELKITSEYDAADLVRLLSDGTYTAEAVTIAFCKRAAIAQQLVNCITEILFETAIARARSLDAARLSNPSASLPPLWGLPVSIKDSFNVAGTDSTIGFIINCNQPATSNAYIVDILLGLGAVIHCKTNIPQTMMTADSENNVFGRTLNPNNTSLTAGGSTGGEGALIAMRGSVLGVGTDIAGSIRIPALCNGIVGFKPTTKRMPYGGQVSPANPGIPGFGPAAGPMATSVRACRLFIESVIAAKPWDIDASCDKLLWNYSTVDSGRGRPRIGVVADLLISREVWPPVRRALRESVQRLKDAGAELIPLTLPNMTQMIETAWSYFDIDGGKFTMQILTDGQEPPIASLASNPEPSGEHATLAQLMRLNHTRLVHQQVFAEYWKAQDIDCIMMPPAPTVAPKHDAWRGVNYTLAWNYLDYPACVLPVDVVNEKDEWDGDGKEESRSEYTGASDYAHAPITIQLVGRRQHDEDLMHVADYVEAVLTKGRKGSSPRITKGQNSRI